MKQTIRKRHDEIRVRAVPNWEPDRREEGPFLPLSTTDTVELGHLGEIIEFKTPATEIVSHGEKSTFLYLLTDGVVEADRTLHSGERQILAFYWPGDTFGLAENGERARIYFCDWDQGIDAPSHPDEEVGERNDYIRGLLSYRGPYVRR
jgi:hypothetical protein